jgi:hypothetical protein
MCHMRRRIHVSYEDTCGFRTRLSEQLVSVPTVTLSAHGTELGSVTLKRVGFFCFPIKHSTHTQGGWG